MNGADCSLADVIAYLEQRRDNAATMARKSPEFAEMAAERERQIQVMIDDLRNGLHEGAAEARAGLMAARAGDAGPVPIEGNCK